MHGKPHEVESKTQSVKYFGESLQFFDHFVILWKHQAVDFSPKLYRLSSCILRLYVALAWKSTKMSYQREGNQSKKKINTRVIVLQFEKKSVYKKQRFESQNT